MAQGDIPIRKLKAVIDNLSDLNYHFNHSEHNTGTKSARIVNVSTKQGGNLGTLYYGPDPHFRPGEVSGLIPKRDLGTILNLLNYV